MIFLKLPKSERENTQQENTIITGTNILKAAEGQLKAKPDLPCCR